MNLLKVLIINLLLIFFTISCSEKNAGNSAETGNPEIKGMVSNADGSPAKNATIYLAPSDYLPYQTEKHLYTTLSDSLGHFLFNNIPEDEYSLEIIAQDGVDRVLLNSIVFDSTSKSKNAEINAHLSEPISLRLGNSSLIGIDSGIVYISGTQYQKKVYVFDGNIFIDSLSAGTYENIIFQSFNDSTQYLTLLDSVKVLENGIENEISKISISKKFNFVLTYYPEIDSSSLLQDIPILLKLDSQMIDFNLFAMLKGRWSAKINGRDLPISTIPSSNNQKAKLIYVKADSIIWGDTINLFFDETQDELWARDVFSKSNWFLNAWHFENTDTLIDFSEQGTHPGITYHLESSSGVVANAAVFSDSSSIEISHHTEINFIEKTKSTLNFWIYFDDLSDEQYILGKGENQFYLKYINNQEWQIALADFSANDSTLKIYSILDDSINVGQWYNLNIGIGNSDLAFYKDGTLLNKTFLIEAQSNLIDTTQNFWIGKNNYASNSTNFKGRIDEFFIYKNLISKSRIDLSHLNLSSNWPKYAK